MDGFTKQETYELLSKYPAELTPKVLNQLGYDESTEIYPADIVERAEKIYESLGVAVDIQKQLAPTESENTAITIQQTTAIAAQLLEQQGISFPPDVVMVLATAAIEEATQLGRGIETLKEAALAAELQAGNKRITQKLLNMMGAGNGIIREVFTSENIQAFVSDAVPQVSAPDVQGFLAGMEERRKQREQLYSSEQKSLEAHRSTPVTVDVKAFLARRGR